MSWQEELRKLDEELAAGRISADDYRVRRDQVLSSAVSTGDANAPGDGASPQQPQTPGQQGNSESTQVVRPVNDPQAGGQSNAESTQFVRNTPPPGGPAQAPQGWQPPAHGGVPQGPPGSPPAGFQQPQQPAWNAPEADATPPWGGTDLPPVSPQAESGWAPQGPESFEETKRSGKGRVIGVVAAVVIVLLAAGTVVYFTAIKGSDTSKQAADDKMQPPSAPPTMSTSTTPPRKTAGALVVPRGQVQGPKTYSQQELLDSKALPEPGRVIVEQVGISQARSVFAVKDDVTVTLWAFKSDKAQELHDKFLEDQKRFGYEKTSSKFDKVEVFTAVQKSGDSDVYVFRAHYVVDSTVIRVQTFGGSKSETRERFNKILTAQLEHKPAAK